MKLRIKKIRARIRLTRKLRCFAHSEQGTYLAELAIVLPLLIVMFAATAEFGRFFYTYTTLAKATRAGARYLIAKPVHTGTDAAAANLVVYGNAQGTGSPVVSNLSKDHIKIERTNRSGITSTLPETVTVRIGGFTYEPLFDLGKLTNNENLSLRIEVIPSTTMRYLLTQPSI